MPDELKGDVAARPLLDLGEEEEAAELSAQDLAGLDRDLGLDDDESADVRAGRRASDARIVEILSADGFEGPRYQKFVGRLTEYGWHTMIKWSASGEIFRRVREAGRPVPQAMITSAWGHDDRLEVAIESVLGGAELFRKYGLVEGRWSPLGGASLTTYFVGAVIRAFPPAYKNWYKGHRMGQSELGLGGGDDTDPMAAIPDQRAADPYASAATNDLIARVLPLVEDRQVREGLGWRAAGYTEEEAAQRVGLTQKALERRTSRLRKRILNAGVGQLGEEEAG